MTAPSASKVDRINQPGSVRYREIDRANMNQPRSALVCPACEHQEAKCDPEVEHPGCFYCGHCGKEFMA